MTTPRILILEDEAIIAMDLRLQLEDRGFDVVKTALKLSEAFKALETTEFDLAICDVRLGDQESYDFARDCRDREIDVIFMSGHAYADMPADLADTSLHRKPVEMVDMMADVSNVLGVQASSAPAA